MKRPGRAKNKWVGKLKKSPRGSGPFNTNGREGKTIVSDATRTTATATCTKGSSKYSKEGSERRSDFEERDALEEGFIRKSKIIWDSDKRQQDIYCFEHGGVEHLTIRQYAGLPVPTTPDHIVVKIGASTVSSKDCIIRIKAGPNASPDPAVPGFHIVGTIHALGHAVDPMTYGIGNRVAALLPNAGGNAKYVSIPFDSAILLPKGANRVEIICLVASYMTAYQCLKLARKDGAPLTNSRILIAGGAGPVGQALIDLAHREGAKVYATTHGLHKEKFVNLGAKWLPMKRPDVWLPHLEGRMRAVIDGLCLDGCEGIGGLSLDAYESSCQALAPDGILVCGSSSSPLLRLQCSFGHCHAFDESIVWGLWQGARSHCEVRFYDINESYEKNPNTFRRELHYLIWKLGRGDIKPRVAGMVGLDQVPKAQKLIEESYGLPNGTLVCLPWKKPDLCGREIQVFTIREDS